MQTIAQRLEEIDLRLARWKKRLRAAFNKIDKLEAQRKRLNGLAPKGEPLAVRVQRTLAAEPAIDRQAIKQLGEAVQRMDAEPIGDLDIPPEFKRDADVDAMKAERRKQEEAERHKMPLTGRAALEAVRPKRKAAPKPKAERPQA